MNSKTEKMMRMKWMLTTFILIGTAALTGAQANGQADAQAGAAAPERAKPASRIQTDVGLSGYEAFTSSTSGNGTHQTPTNGPGGMFELRQIVNPLVGYEMSFSINPSKQSYTPQTPNCALACNNPPTAISAETMVVGFDYVISKKIGNVRPFLLGGLGAFIAIPGATPYGNNTALRPAYIYGGGLDWSFSDHLGVRVQYRGNYYNAPNVSSIYPATGRLTQSAEPMGGIFYRF